MTAGHLPPILEAYPTVGQWLSLLPDGRVTARSGKVEFGQGIRTALAQLVSHELALDPGRVTVEDASTTRSPDEGVTSGSRSIEEANEGLRLAAAELRRGLLEAASARFEVAAADLGFADGFVILPHGRLVPIGDLASDDLVTRRISGRTTPRPVGDGGAIGASTPRVDLPGKVFGRPMFVQDLDLPGMLHARVCRPPGPGATLLELDPSEVEAMPGVRAVVRDGSFVAVLAGREEEAIRASRRLRRLTTWAPGPALPTSPRFLLDEPTLDVVVADGGPELQAGQVTDALTAEYSRPYIAHASLGPSCAVALLEAGRYRVWTHSQGIFHLRQELAKVLGMPDEAVEVQHREGAGCYGANGADDAALDAALLARVVPGTPVRVQWMREDEFAWEPFGTAMFIRLGASLAGDGSILRWSHDVWGNGHRDRPGPAGATDAAARRADGDDPGITNLLAARYLANPLGASVPGPPGSRSAGSGRNADPIYTFPTRRVVNHYVARAPLRVSALRSLGAHANVFAIESFIDEIAVRIGIDPLDHRLRYLADARGREVLTRAAASAGWRAAGRLGDDRGLGLGFARYKNAGAYVAVVAEVEIGQEIRVPRIWATCDAGLVVNPDGLLNQLEGGIIQAASWTLKEEVRFTATGVTTVDWTTYPILPFSEAPELAVELIDRRDEPPCGVGEAVAGPTAAAIGNAVFAATGVRMRDLPLTRERFIAALP